MTHIPPALAAVRRAVRQAVANLGEENLVLVAVSGGADSMVLASAAQFVVSRRGGRVGLVTVDHGLQSGSADQASRVMDWGKQRGFFPIDCVKVQVEGDGGPEAAARRARYDALERIARERGAAAVLLGHTQDDQAETVLLGLARGSGPRAVAGMRPRRGVFRRPFLGLSRVTIREAAHLEQLPIWEDPHNSDPAFARVRLRRLLPDLDATLGGGVVAGLARTAELIQQDSDYLDALASERLDSVSNGDSSLDAKALCLEPSSLRTRILHRWALGLGAPGGLLAAVHIHALDALVVQWRGQGPVWLPGGIAVRREAGRLYREET